MYDILSNKCFGLNLCHCHFSIGCKHNNIIDISTVGDIFISAKRCTHKSLFTIHIELGISNDNFFGIYIVEDTNLCFSLATLPIGLL